MRVISKKCINRRPTFEHKPYDEIRFEFETNGIANSRNVADATNTLIAELKDVEPPIENVDSITAENIGVVSARNVLGVTFTRTDKTTTKAPDDWLLEGWSGVRGMVEARPHLN